MKDEIISWVESNETWIEDGNDGDFYINAAEFLSFIKSLKQE